MSGFVFRSNPRRADFAEIVKEVRRLYKHCKESWNHTLSVLYFIANIDGVTVKHLTLPVNLTVERLSAYS